MKNTLICLGLIIVSLGLAKESRALVPIKSDLQIKITIVPTATPTPIILEKIEPNKIDLKLLPTVTLTPTTKEVVITKVVTQTISPTVEVKENKIEEIKTEEKTENNLKDIFTKVTLALLALIIIIQVWPKKKEIKDK